MGLVAGNVTWAVWTTQTGPDEGHPTSFHYAPTEMGFIHEVHPTGECPCGPQRIDVWHETPAGGLFLPHYRHQALDIVYYADEDEIHPFPDESLD